MKKANKSRKSIKAFCLILTFMLLFQICTAFTSPNGIETSKIGTLYSFVNESKSTIQIACVGNSDLYSGIAPLEIWKNYAYTSTVCASAKQSLNKSYHLLKKIFKTQKPKLVIVETDMFFDRNPKNKPKIQISKNFSDLISRFNIKHLKEDADSVLSPLKLRNELKKAIGKNYLSLKITHGYRYSSKICKIINADYMNPSNFSEQISKDNINEFKKILELCKQNGAEILLLELPSVTSWNYERHNAIETYAKSIGINFIDLNTLNDFDITNCFRDAGNHLNYIGAKAATNYIGNYIKNNYKIEKVTTQSIIDTWNNDLKIFENNL